ncbi:hypothetical protein [Pedobacter gandavensis]|uniref:hypothetical protein n=1 Tax=Pedobacter gandavensis TaxID=2679963 RepID=UPI00292D5FDD|nr:hypothetical protein [Pedobacter gandavensis]
MDEIENFFTKEKDPFYMGGKREGKREEKLETALNMKKLGISILLIAKATGLTKEQIMNIDLAKKP